MSGKFLNCSCWSPMHREVGAERVPQHMNPVIRELRTFGGPFHKFSDDLLCHRMPILPAKDPGTL